MKIEIIICTEAGHLEAQAKLLIYSIRKYSGILKDATIYSYKPRLGKALAKSTLDFFSENNVVFRDVLLNTKYKNYPLANKPLVCAYHEKNSTADVLLFLDSDTYFLQSPDFLYALKPDSLFIRPVDDKIVGSNADFSDENGSYWRQMYEALGVTETKTICTTIDNQEILAYYNSGFVATSTKIGLFQKWCRNFEHMMHLKLMPPKGVFFVEQSVLSATIVAMKIKVQEIPKAFNFPLHQAHRAKNPNYIMPDFSEIGHVHYHKIYTNIKGENRYFDAFQAFAAGRDINQKLITFGVIRKRKQPFAMRIQRGFIFLKQLLGVKPKPQH